MRIIFMGTPDFAVPTLSEILTAGHDVVAAYSQPPRPAGRGMHERPSPVHAFAAGRDIPVLTPLSLRDDAALSTFQDFKADAAIVVAYGLLLPGAILSAPCHGCFNLHASALPRWRGAAPIQRAIMAGDRETAVAIMHMEEGLDTGPVCMSAPVTIGDEMTAGELHDVLAERGADLMVRALAALQRGELSEAPQSNDGITYAAKIDKAESRLDFARSAIEIHNQIRGLSPFPGAWFEVEREGRRERVKALRSRLVSQNGAPGEVLGPGLTIGCGDGAVEMLEVQRAGKRPCSASEFLRGFSLPPGTRLP
ncbi:methionyl-tRNA formyltransferase [Filomicrobium insigne]